jgi:L-2,4-diaminobutyrate decarboxylase
MTMSFREAYAAERFRADGHRLIDRLADYLQRATDGQRAVLPWAPPAEMLQRWPATFPDEPVADPDAIVKMIDAVLEQSHALHHPRYVGHQVSAPLPLAAAMEMVGALLNNGMAVYEMGPVATAMEHHVVRWLGSRIGLPNAQGVLTSGGSIGNLTALLAARQVKAGFDAWNDGLHAGPPLCVIGSTQAHYSIARAVAMLGVGARGMIDVPVDAQYRMRPDALAAALAAAHDAGKRPIAVIASAGSTATGAIDPLEPIADFCAAHDLWLHVDGAHGASAALSPRYRDLLRGIERADSVVWDMHKMMMTPALVTAVLFKDGARSYAPFAQEASYLFHGEGDEDGEWWNVGLRTVECTKRMLSLKVYVALSLFGTRFFGDYVTHTFDQARRFARMLEAAPDFALAIEPALNIVCFRYQPAGVHGREALDALQTRVRRRIVESGRFYLVQTALSGGVHLRTTLMNPLTTDDDLAALLDAIRAAA